MKHYDNFLLNLSTFKYMWIYTWVSIFGVQFLGLKTFIRLYNSLLILNNFNDL